MAWWNEWNALSSFNKEPEPEPEVVPTFTDKLSSKGFQYNETYDENWNRWLDLYIESVHNPYHALRGCAHNQKCYNELMAVREQVLEYLKTILR